MGQSRKVTQELRRRTQILPLRKWEKIHWLQYYKKTTEFSQFIVLQFELTFKEPDIANSLGIVVWVILRFLLCLLVGLFVFETGYHYIAHAGLELGIFLFWHPQFWEHMHRCATTLAGA